MDVLDAVFSSDKAAIILEGVFNNLPQIMYTGYTSLMDTHKSSYRDFVIELLADAQFLEKYFVGCRVPFEEEGHSPRLTDDDTEKPYSGRTPSKKKFTEVMEVVVRLPEPL